MHTRYGLHGTNCNVSLCFLARKLHHLHEICNQDAHLLFFAFLVFSLFVLFFSVFLFPQAANECNSLGHYKCIRRVSTLVKPTIKPERNVVKKQIKKIMLEIRTLAQDAHTSKKRLKCSVCIWVMLY